MEKTYFFRLLNFLIGVSWSVALLGAIVMYRSFYFHGFFIALFAALLGALVGLFFVAIFEYFLYKISLDRKILSALDEINNKLEKTC